MSSFNVKDQLKNQSQNITGKIGELERVKADLKGRLKSLKTQSKSNQKAPKDSVFNQDQPKDRGTKDKSDKGKNASKTTTKGGMDHQNLKELDARSPTKDSKAAGKQGGEEERAETAQSIIYFLNI